MEAERPLLRRSAAWLGMPALHTKMPCSARQEEWAPAGRRVRRGGGERDSVSGSSRDLALLAVALREVLGEDGSGGSDNQSTAIMRVFMVVSPLGVSRLAGRAVALREVLS